MGPYHTPPPRVYMQGIGNRRERKFLQLFSHKQGTHVPVNNPNEFCSLMGNKKLHGSRTVCGWEEERG